MALPFGKNPENVPLNVLFPDAYRRSARETVRDFALIGTYLVTSVCGVAFFFG